MSTTEQQLQALGQELKEKFEYLQNSGQDVTQAKAELENKMAESAAKVKATTTALSRSPEKAKKSAPPRKVKIFWDLELKLNLGPRSW